MAKAFLFYQQTNGTYTVIFPPGFPGPTLGVCVGAGCVGENGNTSAGGSGGDSGLCLFPFVSSSYPGQITSVIVGRGNTLPGGNTTVLGSVALGGAAWGTLAAGDDGGIGHGAGSLTGGKSFNFSSGGLAGAFQSGKAGGGGGGGGWFDSRHVYGTYAVPGYISIGHAQPGNAGQTSGGPNSDPGCGGGGGGQSVAGSLGGTLGGDGQAIMVGLFQDAASHTFLTPSIYTWRPPPGYNGPVLVTGIDPAINYVYSHIFFVTPNQLITINTATGRFNGYPLTSSDEPSNITVTWWPGVAAGVQYTSGSYTWHSPPGHDGPVLFFNDVNQINAGNTFDGVPTLPMGDPDHGGYGQNFVQIAWAKPGTDHTVTVKTGSMAVVWWQ